MAAPSLSKAHARPIAQQVRAYIDSQAPDARRFVRKLRAAEDTARDCGKTLLVLDAVTGGDAARLYERLGWTRVGDIPGYALFPQGGLCSTTVYYRNLDEDAGAARNRRTS